MFLNERAIMAIEKALNDYEEPPGLDWPDHEKEEVTFSHWALDEILLLVWDHPWTLASETVERFAVKMEDYAETSVTADQKRIFAVAAETAWEILEDIQVLEKI